MALKNYTKYASVCAALALLAAPGLALAGTTADLRLDGQVKPLHLVAVTATADATVEQAKQFIAKMGDRGINFLGNPAMSMDAKKKEFTKLLNDSFDMSTIGRFSLGTYWRSATPAQQQEYQKLFRQMIIKVYSKRFSDYKGQKFDVRSARSEGKDVIVTSFIIPPDGPQVQVDWRVRGKSGDYKVVDVIVEGVSMAQTQRADFAGVIQQGGGNVDALLTHLRQ